jgi:hypothetical protein
MKPRILPLLSATLVLLSAAALADIVILHSGARIEGIARADGDKIVVEGVHGSTTVPAGSVKQIVRSKTPLAEYREIAEQVDAANIWDQIELADWCRDNNLTDYEKYHLALALALEPENLYVRMRLGYVEYRGRWLTKSEEMFERGFVKSKGKWLTPQEYDETLLEEKAQAERTAQARAAEEEKRKEERKKRYAAYQEEERAREAQDYFGIPYTSPVEPYYYRRGYWWYRDYMLLGSYYPYRSHRSYPWYVSGSIRTRDYRPGARTIRIHR